MIDAFRFMLFCVVILSSHMAWAQESIVVRSGSHDDYSRIVFDWPSATIFKTNKSAANFLEIEFDRTAQFNLEAIDLEKIRNVSGLKALSTNPGKVQLTIPRTSRFRAFKAGNKVVVDVYNPEGVETPAPPPPEVAQQEVGQQEEVKDEPAQEDAKPEPPAQIRTAAKVEPVEEEPLNLNAIQDTGIANLISLSSSESIGLAVFERDDVLWIVNDKEDLLLQPQVTGPNAEAILPLRIADLEGGKAFLVNNLEGAFTRTQGGGLIWKIIISAAPRDVKPIQPMRKDVNIEKDRSGRVIWPFEEPGEVLDAIDPITGQALKIVTAKSSADFAGPARNFVDFDVLPSAVGLVIVPKTDDLKIRIVSDGVEISHPDGLAILPQDPLVASKPESEEQAQDAKETKITRIYDFKNWQLGGLESVQDNHGIVLAGLNDLPKNAQDESLMTLAKMYVSNALGAEALGFLSMIAQNNPELAKTAEFRAIRGAARIIDNKNELAFRDLSTQGLEAFEEIGFWKGYALADLGDWQQAITVMPKNIEALADYPDLVLNRVGLVNAEIALRAGNVKQAKAILALIEANKKSLLKPEKAALKYLKGEAARQSEDLEKTKKYWKPLTKGKDDLYRAKAGLALTRLLVDEGELDPVEAIDNLERLRYSWRGDELEGQINYWLGRSYFEAEEYMKGLNIMREAAGFVAGTSLGDRITGEMKAAFSNFYLTETLDDANPLDAVALYEQFTELIPLGDEGNKIVDRLAGRLAEADLLSRSGDLLDYQLEHRLDGLQAYDTAVKLAAIRLLDGAPDAATAALEKANALLAELPEELQTAGRRQDMALLRARALSRQGRPDQALDLLEDLGSNPTIHRLAADIAWTAAYWDDAGYALNDVILDEEISLTRPLSEEHSALILRRAVALNLASDRIALANMREKYSDAMAGTEKARIFEVITRPRQNAALSDRETLLGVVDEVDLFSDFLNAYKSAAEPVN